jgi:hypothetical protein
LDLKQEIHIQIQTLEVGNNDPSTHPVCISTTTLFPGVLQNCSSVGWNHYIPWNIKCMGICYLHVSVYFVNLNDGFTESFFVTNVILNVGFCIWKYTCVCKFHLESWNIASVSSLLQKSVIFFVFIAKTVLTDNAARLRLFLFFFKKWKRQQVCVLFHFGLHLLVFYLAVLECGHFLVLVCRSISSIQFNNLLMSSHYKWLQVVLVCRSSCCKKS